MTQDRTTKDNLNNIELVKQLLQDPFQPIFPMPGMWNFALGSIFSIVAFFGSFIAMMSILEIDPKIQFFIVVGTALSITIVLAAATKGFLWAANLIKFLAISPIVIALINITTDHNVNTLNWVFLIFSFFSVVLLYSKRCKALINILAIRRNKIIEMKNDGTYKQKLEEARKRWNIK